MTTRHLLAILLLVSAPAAAQDSPGGAAAHRLQGRRAQEQGAGLQRRPARHVPTPARSEAEERHGAAGARRAPVADDPGGDRGARLQPQRPGRRPDQRGHDRADASRDEDPRRENDCRNARRTRRDDQFHRRRSLRLRQVLHALGEPRRGHGPDVGHALQLHVSGGRAGQVEEPAAQPAAADPGAARVPGGRALRACNVPERSPLVRGADRRRSGPHHAGHGRRALRERVSS